MIRTPLLKGLIGGIAAGLVLVLLTPILALWGPEAWARHAYQTISFKFIAQRVLPATRDPDALIRAAIDYTKRHLYLVDNIDPYDGRPLDYLVEGIGWCDYHAKVFCKLLAARRLHARYAFLKNRDGISPHTIAEVYVRGRWRAIDPFFDLRYANAAHDWVSLEEVTPELVAALPEFLRLKQANTDAGQQILELAQRTFPLPQAPQRSDDFVQDEHPLDLIADGYVRLFGTAFATWYQDRFLGRRLRAIRDPVERLWVQARHYHLYGRLDEAEPIYRALLPQAPGSRYRERIPLFFSRLLMRQRRYAEAGEVLQEFLRSGQETRWAHFQLALCLEELGNSRDAASHFQRYQALGGSKWVIETAQHLARLQGSS